MAIISNRELQKNTSISEKLLPIYEQIIDEEPEILTDNSPKLLAFNNDTEQRKSIESTNYDLKSTLNLWLFSENHFNSRIGNKSSIRPQISMKKRHYLSSKDILSNKTFELKRDKTFSYKNKIISNIDHPSDIQSLYLPYKLEKKKCDFSCIDFFKYISYLFS